MEFFNKNEEVLDIVLTPRGRELLSKGLFKPTSYSFHDIDVTYESNTNEAQNEIETRIKNAVRLKPISLYTVGDNYRDGKTGEVIKRHIFSNKIGDKILGNQYAPAWKLKFIDAPNFQNYVSGSAGNTSVITPNYYLINVTTDTFTNIIENEGLEETIPQINVNYYYEKIDSIKFRKEDGLDYVTTFIIEEKDLFIEVDEINAFEENDFQNFNLEVFLEASEGEDKGKLLSLLFNKQIPDKFSIENYLNISFDKVAEFQQSLNTVDIYGPGGKDTPTNCD
jgi:hypothetical protein